MPSITLESTGGKYEISNGFEEGRYGAEISNAVQVEAEIKELVRTVSSSELSSIGSAAMGCIKGVPKVSGRSLQNVVEDLIAAIDAGKGKLDEFTTIADEYIAKVRNP